MTVQPLRILQVVEATNGGVGRHFLDLCGELVDRGHDVHAAFSPKRMAPDFEDRLSAITELRAVPIPMHRSPHPGDLVSLARLVGYIRRHATFDLVHGHSSKGGALARVAGVLTGRPAIYTPNAFRTSDPTVRGVARLAYGAAERMLGGGNSDLVAVSDEERQHALDLGLDPCRVHVCLNGLPERSGDGNVDRESLGLPADAVVVGFVGRLSHQKAPERMIEIAAGLETPAVHWVMVGDGPLAESLHTRCRDLGLDANFHWLGARDGYAVMATFDVMVLPSRYEGFAYVLIEALQRGLPIVVSDVAGARHAVQHGRNGFVCDEGDIGALVTAVRQLVESRDLRASMALASRERAGLFTLSRMVDRTERVYGLALSRSA